MAAKLPELAQIADVLLGNLEDAIPGDEKVEAREQRQAARPGRGRRCDLGVGDRDAAASGGRAIDVGWDHVRAGMGGARS